MKRELMIPVEQTVRPIFASLERKMRMREELYSLLHDHWQAALAAGRTDADAVTDAIAAFGTPAEIRKELQASVPAIERFTYGTAIRLFSVSPTPTFRESLQVGAGHALLLAAFVLPVMLPRTWSRGEQVSFVANFLLTLCLLYGFNSAWATWLGGRTVADLEAGRKLRVLLRALLGGMLFAGSYGLFTWGGSEQGLSLATQLRILAGGLSYFAIFLLVCRQLRKERQKTRPWLSLSWEKLTSTV